LPLGQQRPETNARAAIKVAASLDFPNEYCGQMALFSSGVLSDAKVPHN
jgi:hypothetical protein